MRRLCGYSPDGPGGVERQSSARISVAHLAARKQPRDPHRTPALADRTLMATHRARDQVNGKGKDALRKGLRRLPSRGAVGRLLVVVYTWRAEDSNYFRASCRSPQARDVRGGTMKDRDTISARASGAEFFQPNRNPRVRPESQFDSTRILWIVSIKWRKSPGARPAIRPHQRRASRIPRWQGATVRGYAATYYSRGTEVECGVI